MEFEEALVELGFAPVERRGARGVRSFAAEPNRFTTYTVQVYEDGTALFTWEFAIAEYLDGIGVQVGSNEALNLFMFPKVDDRGPQEAAWLAAAIERAEQQLRSIRFDDPER